MAKRWLWRLGVQLPVSAVRGPGLGQVADVCCVLLCALCFVLGTWCLVPVVWCLVLGACGSYHEGYETRRPQRLPGLRSRHDVAVYRNGQDGQGSRQTGGAAAELSRRALCREVSERRAMGGGLQRSRTAW